VDKTSLCDICLLHYQPERVPVILPCGHTLCKDCSCLLSNCHLCRYRFEQDDVLRIHVDFERLPAIMADADSSLGELNLNELDISQVEVDAMPGIPEAEVHSCPDSQSSSDANDAAYNPEAILVAMEGMLRDSMDQHRKELKRLKKLAKRQEEWDLAQALALSTESNTS